MQLKEVWLASKNIIYKNDFSAKHTTRRTYLPITFSAATEVASKKLFPKMIFPRNAPQPQHREQHPHTL